MSKLSAALGLDAQNAQAADRWGDFIAYQAGIRGELVALTRLMDQWLPKEVLWSGLEQLKSDGTAERSFRQPCRAIFVVNNTGATLTVLAGPRAASAPNLGPGVHQVPAGMAMTINGLSSSWSFYGTAGATFDLQCFGHYIDPALGGGGGGGGAIGGSP